MKVVISVLGLVQVVLLLASISFLSLTIWSYLRTDIEDMPMARDIQKAFTQMFGIGFLISFAIFAALFIQYWNRKEIEQENEGVKP